MHWLTVSPKWIIINLWVTSVYMYYIIILQTRHRSQECIKATTECFIDYLLVTEVSVPIPGIICFPKGSPKGISCVSRDSIGFPKEIFGSLKEVICVSKDSIGCFVKEIFVSKGVICVSKDSIGFSKERFGSLKGVSQISLRVCQMMYVDQFEVLRCTNHSIMATQRSKTSRFSVGVSGGNSKPTIKQPKEVCSRKHCAHCAHCLKAVPGYWCKIAKYCKRILLPVIMNCWLHGKKATLLECFNL